MISCIDFFGIAWLNFHIMILLKFISLNDLVAVAVVLLLPLLAIKSVEKEIVKSLEGRLSCKREET